ncbi:3'-5'-exoribonuclease family protein isoform 2 [Forsythia ovata]|uniref:3'-5'-exoribonuclease family protein isoform 2 n=1 Tax=Forsythia ovata TaxID=205694 RepID=A0ABD1PYG0_9LAMI
MEHSTKEIDESDTVTSEELVRIDGNIPTNPIGLEGCSMIASAAFCVSTSSEWLGSSTSAILGSLEGDALNRGEMYLADSVHPSTSLTPVNDEGLLLEELTVKNYDYGSSNSSFVSCSTTREGVNHKGRYLHQLGAHGPNNIIIDRDLISRNKDPLALISREDLQRTSSSYHELKPLSSRQNDKDYSTISSHLTDGHGKKSSSTLPLGYDRSKAVHRDIFSYSSDNGGVHIDTPHASFPGTRSACINAATLALADAGIPMCDLVTSCSAGYLNSTPLLDLNYVEDSAGGPDVTVGILPNLDKVTLLQMDAELQMDTFENVMQLAIEGCKAVANYLREVRAV